MAKQPSTNRANRGSSAPQDRAAKIQAVQKATSTGGANKIVIAGIVAILAIVFAVGGVIWNQKANESDVAAGGNSVPAGASVDGGLVTNASVKLVDGAPTLALYEDFQCPNCKAFEGAFGSAIKEIADSGKAKVSYHILNFLDERGTNQSTMVANGAFCALDQGKFMEFHNAAYAGQYPEGDTVTLDQVSTFATAAGLSGDALKTWQTCVKVGKYTNFIKDTNTAAFKIANFKGTPTVILNGEMLTLSTPEALTKAVTDAAKG